MKKPEMPFGKRLFFLLCALLVSLPASLSAAPGGTMESLGKELFFDNRLSSPPGQSCAACHGPKVGFTGPSFLVNATGAVYPGAIPWRFGNRKPPTSAYGGDSPILRNEEDFFIGGMFWDGRATGEVTGDPLADQAMGPFLNPVEQNMPSEEAVCEKVASGPYAFLYTKVFGPLDCNTLDSDGHLVAYKNFARAIAAYERSREVNPFSSKYDYFTKGLVRLSAQEKLGMELFNGKAMCSACHPAPLFTDFTYDNLGVPKNPLNPFYFMDKVTVNGEPINPQGRNWVDPGLGGFLLTRPEYAEFASVNWGKQKVPTLRNVDLRPGFVFAKDFSHNGYFKSLEGIVNFYNTRDVKPVCSSDLTMFAAMSAGCWPAPEVMDNMNADELGDLGLTPKEEAAIVAFLKTLSDGYRLK